MNLHAGTLRIALPVGGRQSKSGRNRHCQPGNCLELNFYEVQREFWKEFSGRTRSRTMQQLTIRTTRSGFVYTAGFYLAGGATSGQSYLSVKPTVSIRDESKEEQKMKTNCRSHL